MMKEKQIRTLLPFLIVFASTFFLSGADLLQDFGPRIEMLWHNARLFWLLISSDAVQGIASFIISWILYRAWYKNRHKNFWFSDMMWQFSGAFFCWFLLCAMAMIGTFYQFLWMQGMLRLFIGIFLLYMANTLIAAKSKLYYPETPEEALEKAAKFDELLKTLKP